MTHEGKRFLIEDRFRLLANRGLTATEAGLIDALLLSEIIFIKALQSKWLSSLRLKYFDLNEESL